MAKSIVRAFFALALVAVLCGLGANRANAVGDLYLKTTGPGQAQVTLSLTDPQGQTVPVARDEDARGDVTHIRDLPAGTYKATVTVNGETKPPQEIVVRDNQVNSYAIDRRTGLIALAAVPLQQQQLGRFSIGALGGFKRTPYDGEITSSALGSFDSGELSDTLGEAGVEFRYYLPRSQIAQLGADLFILGSYIHYFGGPLARYFGDRHAPVPGNDVGVSFEEKHSFRLGIGASLNVLQRAGIGLMFGAHWTEVQVAALGNEFPVGNNNSFSHTQTLRGPFLALEAFYTLAWLQGIGPLQAALRTTLLWMPDVEARGTSSLNFDYSGRAVGGTQVEVLSGLRVLF